MATPKLKGTTPEPFDGKAANAETFLAELENYYYLNEDVYATEGRRVAAALTHFKRDSPAGEWARDRSTAARNANPLNYGTWADFIDDFKAHFVPAETQLEAGAMMHNYPQGNRPFNEWYQTWYTHASRAGVDEQTKMFAFRRNLNQALHNKLLTVSPQPTTLTTLVTKAREFDRLYQLYNSRAFNQRQGTRIRNSTIPEEEPRIAASNTPNKPQQRGRLTKEEREHRFKNKLCLYCGKPNHIAKECRQKDKYNQGKRPGIPPAVRSTATMEPIIEETPEALQISSLRVSSPVSYDLGIMRPKSAPQDF